MNPLTSKEIPHSGFLLINKHRGITSSDLVLKIKRILKLKKIGHTGTLDKNAEGLMILPFGNYTSFSSILLGQDKAYLAEILPGKSTDSGDLDGNFIEEWEEAKVREVFEKNSDVWRNEFNEILKWKTQIPPKISAIKNAGKRQSDLFRKNIEFEDRIRDINILSLNLEHWSSLCIRFQIRVSSGTYIRKIAIDLSEKWGIPLVIQKLKRTEIGDLTLEEASTLNEISEGKLPKFYSLDEILQMDKVEVTYPEERKILNGNFIQMDHVPHSDFLLINQDNKILAWANGEGSGIYKYKKVFSNPN
ncbi:MAG: tRNA pseudouridine(55) synthase TruB [Leptospiraceae bacterium]|nr:tRNA pseudouridine(55) synthase TruB [Leptospiraceae bacterium]MCP5513235.1 tRNA pseudouridine(55) synthase TruB [Leptospiraceae bacterium]